MSSGNKRSGGNPLSNVIKKSPAAPQLKPVTDLLDDEDDDAPKVEDSSSLTPPSLDAAAVLTASSEERKKGRKGRASTMLTGGEGLSDKGLSLARKTLIGR